MKVIVNNSLGLNAEHLAKALKAKANKQKAAFLQRYFKTAPGEYGEGDRFIGITVPVLRSIARNFDGIALSEVKKSLVSEIHEQRYVALLILNEQYEKGSVSVREKILKFYLRHLRYVNNWDLVDTSAPYILGATLHKGNRAILNRLVKSSNIWERRVAVVATYTLIRADEYQETLRLAEVLLSDKHDLMHKAVGWMLREVGKRDRKVLDAFLKKHAAKMPRTMLRYAIERHAERERKQILRTYRKK